MMSCILLDCRARNEALRKFMSAKLLCDQTRGRSIEYKITGTIQIQTLKTLLSNTSTY